MTALLRVPCRELIPAYATALIGGWYPDNMRPDSGAESLKAVTENPDEHISELCGDTSKPILLPDRSFTRRLPGFSRWMISETGEFCGDVGIRYVPGTPELPPTVLGHIGYSVVAAYRRRGYATRALKEMLINACALGMPYVLLTTGTENVASISVIRKCGGVEQKRFNKPAVYGGGPSIMWRIEVLAA